MTQSSVAVILRAFRVVFRVRWRWRRRTAPLEVKRRDPNLVRLTQVGLLIASLGAVLVIFNPFSLGVVGLVLAALGTVLAARGGLGKTWFWVVAGATIVAILSRLIADGSEVAGRLARGYLVRNDHPRHDGGLPHQRGRPQLS